MLHDVWSYEASLSGVSLYQAAATNLTADSSTNNPYYYYTGNPGMIYPNGLIGNTVDVNGWLVFNRLSNGVSNPLYVMASQVQDWSGSTKFWIGFRTKAGYQPLAGNIAPLLMAQAAFNSATKFSFVQESDLAGVVANTEAYVEVLIDSSALTFQVWINNTMVRQGAITAGVIGANCQWTLDNSTAGAVANSIRSYRDLYFLDVDATTTTRLGPIKSVPLSGTVQSSPNYQAYGVSVASILGNAVMSTAQSKFGGASLLVDQTASSGLLIPGSNATVGAGDFTVEQWIYPTNLGVAAALFRGDNNAAAGVGLDLSFTATTLYGGYSGGTVVVSAPISGNFVNNTWYHIALVNKAGTWTLYANGVSLATGTYSTAIVTPTLYRIGCSSASTTAGFKGYIDDLRVSNVARYLANFTPPAASLSVDANTLCYFPMNYISNGQTEELVHVNAQGVLFGPLSNAPVTPPLVKNGAGTLDALTMSFDTSLIFAQANVLAVDYRHASQASAASALHVNLKDGTNNLALSDYTFTDATMKYLRRANFARTAADGQAWTIPKVASNQLVLTPTV